MREAIRAIAKWPTPGGLHLTRLHPKETRKTLGLEALAFLPYYDASQTLDSPFYFCVLQNPPNSTQYHALNFSNVNKEVLELYQQKTTIAPLHPTNDYHTTFFLTDPNLIQPTIRNALLHAICCESVGDPLLPVDIALSLHNHITQFRTI